MTHSTDTVSSICSAVGRSSRMAPQRLPASRALTSQVFIVAFTRRSEVGPVVGTSLRWKEPAKSTDH